MPSYTNWGRACPGAETNLPNKFQINKGQTAKQAMGLISPRSSIFIISVTAGFSSDMHNNRRKKLSANFRPRACRKNKNWSMSPQPDNKNFVPARISALQAPIYVVTFGVIFGVTISMAKLGAQQGLSPMALVFWQMLGAGVLLAITATVKGQRPKLIPRHLRYYVIAGILGNAFPTTLTFLAASKIGTGLAGLVYPLSPVFTYAFAVLFGMDKPHRWKITGLGLGLVGAMIIIVSPLIFGNGEHYADISIFWLAIVFTVPIFLACGNIYRSRDWPPNTGSLPLAAGMLIATALMLLPVLILTGNFKAPDLSGSSIDWIILANTVLSYVDFIVYFELQRIAGPVYFSQVSYFITITTMAIGVILFNEVLDYSVWVAVIFIFTGLYLVSKARS